jgi:hypothetical protein
MLSAITAECCPPSAWNRVRDRAEYAFQEFQEALAKVGIECKTTQKRGNQEISGIMFKQRGQADDCFLAGSSIDRACSWNKLSAVIQATHDQQQAAVHVQRAQEMAAMQRRQQQAQAQAAQAQQTRQRGG